MANIRFDQVQKVFAGGVVAVAEFSLEIPSPTLVVLVGPSGCGKTTLLRMIAGLERPSSGRIWMGDERLDSVEPRRRDVSMVFQNYALYPHMTVRENLSFGLKIRKLPRQAIVQKVKDVSESLEIDSLLDRRPAELSGGQRQRVALGRAIVREPRVFLFDEPLSNLDARLRDDMRYLIKKLYQRLQTTMVYVTHDQVEAMTIGEMLVVMKNGRIHQVGSPSDCYSRPRDPFVASFLGSPPMNLLDAAYLASERALVFDRGPRLALTPGLLDRLNASGGKRVTVGIRPEDMGLSEREPASSGSAAGPLSLEGVVAGVEVLGHDVLAHVEVAGIELVVRKRWDGKGGVGSGATIHLSEDRLHLWSEQGERIA